MMKKRATAAVQKAMAGCLTSVVILAVLAGLATAVIESHRSRNVASKVAGHRGSVHRSAR